MKIGFHMPLSGGFSKQLKRAQAIGAETIQIFSGNPTSWNPGTIDYEKRDQFVNEQIRCGINPLVFHTPYLINLASPKEDVQLKSVTLLKAALEKAHAYSAPYVVTHIGSHLGEGETKGLERVCQNLEGLRSAIPSGITLLLENTAGSGSLIGADLHQIGRILDWVDGERNWLGCCFDTAHAYAAGYDLSTQEGVDKTMTELTEKVGCDSVKVIHANDTSVSLGSHKDRHEHIGQGNITLNGFRHLLTHEALSPKAVILETPEIGTDKDGENLDCLKQVVKEG